jgi:hypothetical protein
VGFDVYIFVNNFFHSFNHLPLNYSSNLNDKNDASLNFSNNPTQSYHSSNTAVSAPHIKKFFVPFLNNKLFKFLILVI